MLSVVVPAYNEARRLPPSLVCLRDHLDAIGEAYEVIVVDDGSRDGTSEVAAAVARTWPQLLVRRLDANRGKGAAVRTGMLAARGELRLMTDADLSTPLEELGRLRERIGGRCTVAIASRALPGSRIETRQRWYRELIGRSGNRLVQLLLLPGIHDTQCGFKLFTAEAAVACFEVLETPGFGFDIEVLVRARRRGWTIAEVPVRWGHVEASSVSAPRDALATLADVLRLRRRLRHL